MTRDNSEKIESKKKKKKTTKKLTRCNVFLLKISRSKKKTRIKSAYSIVRIRVNFTDIHAIVTSTLYTDYYAAVLSPTHVLYQSNNILTCVVFKRQSFDSNEWNFSWKSYVFYCRRYTFYITNRSSGLIDTIAYYVSQYN